MSTIDPTRYYVATNSYVSPATEEHLRDNGGVARKGMKLRGDHPVVLANPTFWIDASEDPETAALASAVADRLRRSTGGPPIGEGITVERIDAALEAWTSDWPPAQDDFADMAFGVTDRRIRQVLKDAGTSWAARVDEVGLRR